jgi:phage-related baseplate assembly protein
MTLPTKDDLVTLPLPAIIESLDFETILARRKDIFALAAQVNGLDLGQFLMLESSTETILLEEAAYSELLLRSRINQVYRSKLLYFATGTDLDHVAEEHGVTRLAGESDSDLRIRVRLRNRGSSAAGPDDWWKYWAMTADAGVEDVTITRIDYPFPAPNQKRGKIIISILARTPDGVASDALLAKVDAVVQSRAIRGVTTEVEVRRATQRTFDLAADVYLLPSAQASVFTGLDATLKSAFVTVRGLGFDIPRVWLSAQLMQPGVQRIEITQPTTDLAVAADEFPLLGTVTLTLKGRAY